MRIRALGYNLSLFALVTISVLSLHLTAAAQICSSGVCVPTWQRDTICRHQRPRGLIHQARYSWLHE
jgi:hypothetical protein